MKRLVTLVLAAALLCAAVSAVAADFQVVVNTGNGISSIEKDALAKIFFKKTTKWGDGTKAAPVDLVASSAVREAFSEAVLGKSVAAVKSYWQRQVFSGRGVPPVEKSSDAEVIDFVKGAPGGVGYVSATADVSGVKVITIR